MTGSGGPGRVILLNGTSSAGKTTLARAIQEAADEPYLYWGIDTLFAMVPEKWAGARGGPLSFDGFRYDRSERDADGRPLVSIRYGAAGRRMLDAARASVAVLALRGCHLVIDEMLLTPDLMDHWLRDLAGIEVLLVGVHCPVDELDRRERARGNPPGLARAHLRTVHAHGIPYDLDVDTTATDTPTLARTVLRARARGRRTPPPGFRGGGGGRGRMLLTRQQPRAARMTANPGETTMHMRRPITGTVLVLILVVAALSGAGATALAAAARTTPLLADTGFNRGPFVLGGAVFLLVGAAAMGVAMAVHHRAVVRAEEDDPEDD